LIGPSEDAPPPAGQERVRSRQHVVRARWTVRPRPGLPDAAEWGTTLSGAVMQAWLGQRPVSQLTRWLDEEVLVAISMQQRRRRAAGPRSVLPVTVRSVRVQHPHAEVAELAAHLSVGQRSVAMALRLEAVGDRWLGTAVELGPRIGPAQTTREEVIE
jgi:hypothetical protein